MMGCPPIPAFPAIGVVMDFRMANGIHEAEVGGEVISNIAPGMMRTMRRSDGARPVFALHAFDFTGNNVERFIPGDPLITGNAAVLRIAFAIGIEIHPFHRIEAAIR